MSFRSRVTTSCFATELSCRHRIARYPAGICPANDLQNTAAAPSSDLPSSLSPPPTPQDALLHGCIPVAIMDNTLNALCTHLDCTAFSIRIAEKDLERLGDIIDAVPQASAGQRRNHALLITLIVLR